MDSIGQPVLAVDANDNILKAKGKAKHIIHSTYTHTAPKDGPLYRNQR